MPTIEIMTTRKTTRRGGVISTYPNLDIKSVNGRPFGTKNEYLPDGEHVRVTLEYEEAI